MEADVFDHPAPGLEIGRRFAGLDPAADQRAEDAAEVFVARERKEAALIGEHANEARKQAEIGQCHHLPAHAVDVVIVPLF